MDQNSKSRGLVTVTQWAQSAGARRMFYYDPTTDALAHGTSFPAATGWLWSEDFDEFDTFGVGIQIKKTVSGATYPADWGTASKIVAIGIVDDTEMAYVKAPADDGSGMPGPYCTLSSSLLGYHDVAFNGLTQFLATTVNDVGQLSIRFSSLPGHPSVKPYRRIGYCFCLQPSAVAGAVNHSFEISCVEHYGRIGSVR